MLARDRVSLNALAFESTCRLVEGVLARGVNLAEAFIDALGDTTKHQVGRLGRLRWLARVVGVPHCRAGTQPPARRSHLLPDGATDCRRRACLSASRACALLWRPRRTPPTPSCRRVGGGWGWVKWGRGGG